MARAVSSVERETLRFIIKYVADHSHPPIISEMAAAAGVSTTAIIGRLSRLERKGLIRRVPGQARTIVVLAEAS